MPVSWRVHRCLRQEAKAHVCCSGWWTGVEWACFAACRGGWGRSLCPWVRHLMLMSSLLPLKEWCLFNSSSCLQISGSLVSPPGFSAVPSLTTFVPRSYMVSLFFSSHSLAWRTIRFRLLLNVSCAQCPWVKTKHWPVDNSVREFVPSDRGVVNDLGSFRRMIRSFFWSLIFHRVRFL